VTHIYFLKAQNSESIPVLP